MFISTFYNDGFGGAEVSAKKLKKLLIARGHNVYVYSRGTYIQENSFGFGLKFVSKKMFILGNFLIDKWYARQLYQALKRNNHNPDLIHVQDLFAVPAAYHVAKKMNIPVIVTIRDSLPRVLKIYGFNIFSFRNKTYKKYLKKIDAIIAISDYIKKSTVSFLGNHNKIMTIYNIPPNIIQRSLKGKKRKTNTVNLLAIGRLEAEKGFIVLINALKLIVEQNIIKVHLKIVGSGPEIKKILNKIHKYNLDEYISIEGKVPNAKIGFYYENADIIVFPSVYQEPLGRIALEAASYGKPVIASRVGGIPEIVQDNKTGILVQPNDAYELSNKIILLSTNEKKIEKISYFAKKEIKKKFDRDKLVTQTLKYYKRILCSPK